jgi:hypothetical protein
MHCVAPFERQYRNAVVQMRRDGAFRLALAGPAARESLAEDPVRATVERIYGPAP